MFRSITALSLLLSMSLQGQDVAGVQPAASRWSVGVNAAPAMAYRQLAELRAHQYTSIIMDNRNEREIPLLTGHGSLMAAYALSEKIGIEGGIGYSRFGWDHPLKDLTFGDQIDPRRGFVYSTSADLARPITFRETFHYLDIPIRATVSLGRGKLKWIGSLGVSASILMRASHISIYAEGRKEYEQHLFGRFNLFPTIGTGVAYRLNDRHELRLEPTFRYGMLKITDQPITGYLWSAGVNLGWYVRL
jgi:hypothetical protein